MLYLSTFPAGSYVEQYVKENNIPSWRSEKDRVGRHPQMPPQTTNKVGKPRSDQGIAPYDTKTNTGGKTHEQHRRIYVGR